MSFAGTATAVGSLMSGASGLTGNMYGTDKKEWDFYHHQATNPLKFLLRDAEKYGIHPLAALGHNAYAGPMPQSTGGHADLSRMGQAFKDLGKIKQSNDINTLNKKLLEEDLRHKRLVNDGLESQPDSITEQDLITGAIKHIPSQQESSMAGNSAYTASINSMYQVILGPGRYGNITYTQNASEPMETDMATNFENQARKLGARIMAGAGFSDYTKATRIAEFFRAWKPTSIPTQYDPKSWEWRWDLQVRKWKLMPKEGKLIVQEEFNERLSKYLSKDGKRVIGRPLKKNVPLLKRIKNKTWWTPW